MLLFSYLGHRFIVPCTTKGYGKRLVTHLHTLFPEKKDRIVHIHAESGKSLSSANWVNYDVLIHTGVFESAINFKVVHFDGIIGFATGGKFYI